MLSTGYVNHNRGPELLMTVHRELRKGIPWLHVYYILLELSSFGIQAQTPAIDKCIT